MNITPIMDLTGEIETVDYGYETARSLDPLGKQVFEDLLSPRNSIDWDPADVESFLAAKGNLVSERITGIASEMPEIIAGMLMTGTLKKSAKIVLCVYSRPDMSLEDLEKIVNRIRASLPPETELLFGWIPDEQADKNRVTLHLMAVCAD